MGGTLFDGSARRYRDKESFIRHLKECIFTKGFGEVIWAFFLMGLVSLAAQLFSMQY